MERASSFDDLGSRFFAGLDSTSSGDLYGMGSRSSPRKHLKGLHSASFGDHSCLGARTLQHHTMKRSPSEYILQDFIRQPEAKDSIVRISGEAEAVIAKSRADGRKGTLRRADARQGVEDPGCVLVAGKSETNEEGSQDRARPSQPTEELVPPNLRLPIRPTQPYRSPNRYPDRVQPEFSSSSFLSQLTRDYYSSQVLATASQPNRSPNRYPDGTEPECSSASFLNQLVNDFVSSESSVLVTPSQPNGSPPRFPPAPSQHNASLTRSPPAPSQPNASPTRSPPAPSQPNASPTASPQAPAGNARPQASPCNPMETAATSSYHEQQVMKELNPLFSGQARDATTALPDGLDVRLHIQKELRDLCQHALNVGPGARQMTLPEAEPALVGHPAPIPNRSVTSGSSQDQSDDEEMDDESVEPGDENMEPGNENVARKITKRERRMQSNRESARRSRSRKQARLRDLEDQVFQLQTQNSTSERNLHVSAVQCKALVAANFQLKMHVQMLQLKLKHANEMRTHLPSLQNGPVPQQHQQSPFVIEQESSAVNGNAMRMQQPTLHGEPVPQLHQLRPLVSEQQSSAVAGNAMRMQLPTLHGRPVPQLHQQLPPLVSGQGSSAVTGSYGWNGVYNMQPPAFLP